MTPETKRIIIAAGSGFVIGRVLEQIKQSKRRVEARRKYQRDDTQFWKTIEKYLSNPNDHRTVEQMVSDWQTRQEFNKIVKDNNL